MNWTTHRKRLREVLEGNGCTTMASVWDPITSRLAERMVARNADVCLGASEDLVDRARALGARLATGHYARTAIVDGETHLLRGKDHRKDQSYVLFGVPRHELAHMLLPLGDLEKSEVRTLAENLGLPVFNKPDSQEICFVPDNDYARLVQKKSPDTVRPGTFVDADGHTLGTHEGHQHFTIGQRKGLGVALGSPAYVAEIDAATGEVRLGGAESLLHAGARLRDARFMDDVALPVRAAVKVRYRHEGANATVCRDDAGVYVEFDQPVRAIARGQVAVAYAGFLTEAGYLAIAPSLPVVLPYDLARDLFQRARPIGDRFSSLRALEVTSAPQNPYIY